MTPLREKMLNDLRIRNLAENTQKAYLQAVTGLARYYRRSPDQLPVREVQDYLLYLSQERHLAWTSCNTIRHGLRFFYRVTLERPATEFYLPCAKEPLKLPEILSHEELVHLFTVTTNSKHRALVTPGRRGKGRKSGASDDTQNKSPEKRRASMNWAQRLKRVFNIDVEICDQCGGVAERIAQKNQFTRHSMLTTGRGK
jgi:hypothetical protein